MRIITTHKGADFDALASTIACTLLYPGAMGVLPNQLNREVEAFLAIHQDMFRIKPRKGFDLSEVTSLIVVDANNWQRLDNMTALQQQTELEVICWDHHMEGVTIESDKTYREEIGASVTLLLEEMQRKDTPLSPIHATLFLLGIYADTGCLRYSSATARDARMAGFLLENGADLNVVSAYLDSSVDEAHTEVFSSMLEASQISDIDGVKVGLCAIPVQSGLSMLAPLVTKYKEFKGVDAAFGIFATELEKCIVIGRGNPQQIDIGALMRTLDGGGHPGAGSAMLKGVQIDQASNKILALLKEHNSKPLPVAKIMSAPKPYVVSTSATMAQAHQHLTARNLSGVIICEGEKFIGSLSANDFVKAEKKGRSETSVKGFANRQAPCASPENNSKEALELMNQSKEGLLPVVENGKLVGVLTRGDILLQIYQF
ncbi:MAG: CBS domain-containing protein [Desulfuromonadales bacterium]|nr:CBS domain-containing protein [Desulfuromonadales bacterium]